MAKKDVFDDPISIQYRGTYDYDGLVSFLRGYMMGLKPNVYAEPKFKYKTGKTGAEVDFQIKAIRKITHYIRVTFIVSGHAFDVIRRDIEENGQKKTVTDGKIELQLEGKFEVDYPGMFDSENKLEKWMDKKLNSEPDGLIYQDNKVTGKKFAITVLLDLDQKIKSFLKMECY